MCENFGSFICMLLFKQHFRSLYHIEFENNVIIKKQLQLKRKASRQTISLMFEDRVGEIYV